MPEVTPPTPRVSVIIPTHNRARFISQAIESILEQTYSNYEIIVVDDGSTDETRQVIQSFCGPIHYTYQNNHGVSFARNRGIELAKGEYITFLDSDDWYLPSKLEKQTRYLDNNLEMGVVYSWYFEVYEDDSRQYLCRPNISGDVYKRFLSRCMFGLMAVPTVMIRKEVLTKVGLFDERMTLGEDTDLWCRLARFHKVGLILEPLCNIRRHSENTGTENTLPVFLRIADKAFQADKDLSWIFKRRVYADIYGISSSYLLFDKAKKGMAMSQLLRGLLYWPCPFQTIRVYANRVAFTAVNNLPKQLSSKLLQWWRQRKAKQAGNAIMIAKQ